MRRQLINLVRRVHAGVSGFPSDASNKKGFSTKKIVFMTVAGFGIGAVGGLAHSYRKIKLANTYIANSDDENPYIIPSLPPFDACKKIIYPNDASQLKITLFQYQTCPFCCKVRTLLDFFGVSYEIVEVNPVLRTQLKWSQNYRKVPILVVETPQGNIFQLNDSSMIVSCLFSYLFAKKEQETNESENETLRSLVKAYPNLNYVDEDGKKQSEIMNKYFLMLGSNMAGRTKESIAEERKWRKWADAVYVHTLSPNIYRTLPEAIDAFRYFDEVGDWERYFTSWERALVIYIGAVAMWMVGKRLQKKYRLYEDVRQSIYEESNFWMNTIKKKNNGIFMGGKSPDLSDLAMFGILSSIEGCETFQDLSKNSRIIRDWYYKVKEQLKKSEATVVQNIG